MNHLRRLVPTALVFLFMGSSPRAKEQPQLQPMRDLDITYEVTRPDQPVIRERVRWLASEHLQRVDGSDQYTAIFDGKTQYDAPQSDKPNLSHAGRRAPLANKS